MKVQDVMTSPARSCTPDATLVGAAQTLWDHDCGALPVLDSDGRPVGMITDRDICMALARRNRFPGDIRVREVMSSPPSVCRPSDEIEEALQRMAVRRVRRLPVVDGSGSLIGIISVNDVAAGASEGRDAARGAAEIHRKIIEALLAICVPAKGSSKKSA